MFSKSVCRQMLATRQREGGVVGCVCEDRATVRVVANVSVREQRTSLGSSFKHNGRERESLFRCLSQLWSMNEWWLHIHVFFMLLPNTKNITEAKPNNQHIQSTSLTSIHLRRTPFLIISSVMLYIFLWFLFSYQPFFFFFCPLPVAAFVQGWDIVHHLDVTQAMIESLSTIIH